MHTQSIYSAKLLRDMAAAGIVATIADAEPTRLTLRRARRAIGTVSFDPAAVRVTVGDLYVPPVVHVELTGGPRRPAVSMRIDTRRGRPVCTELLIGVGRDGGEVRPKDLCAIDIDALVTLAVARCADSVIDPDSVPRVDEAGAMAIDRWKVDGANGRRVPVGNARAADAAESTRRRSVERARMGRPRLPHQHLVDVAEVYRSHTGRAPTKAVADHWGVKPRTAAEWVQKCRSDEHQLLPKTVQGQRKA